jgi:hypothetical protein
MSGNSSRPRPSCSPRCCTRGRRSCRPRHLWGWGRRTQHYLGSRPRGKPIKWIEKLTLYSIKLLYSWQQTWQLIFVWIVSNCQQVFIIWGRLFSPLLLEVSFSLGHVIEREVKFRPKIELISNVFAMQTDVLCRGVTKDKTHHHTRGKDMMTGGGMNDRIVPDLRILLFLLSCSYLLLFLCIMYYYYYYI